LDENLHDGWNYHKWEDPSEYPRFRYYRFYGISRRACVINEITFTGVETIDNSDTTKTCPVKLVTGESNQDLNSIVYSNTLTPLLTAVSPRFGTVVGGTEVTFTGTNFVTDISLYKITIDGIDCPVSAASTSSVTCTTGKRPGLVETSLEIYITGLGLVSN